MKAKKILLCLLCLTLLFSVFSLGVSAEEQTGVTTADWLNVRKGPGKSHSKVCAALPEGSLLVVLDKVHCDDGDDGNPWWYKVEFNYGGDFYTDCYVSAAYVRIIEDIPRIYKPYIAALKEAHPEWEFDFLYTGLDWNDDVLKNEDERVKGRNLVSGVVHPVCWRAPKAYDPKEKKWVKLYDPGTGKWTPLDGKSWFQANSAVVAHFMDPRNFLTESEVFQFELLSYDPTTQTPEGVQKMLQGSFMENTVIEGFPLGDVTGDGVVDIADAMKLFQFVSGKLEELGEGAARADMTGDGTADIADAMKIFQTVSGKLEPDGRRETLSYAETFMRAAKASGVSPYHLAARVIQEVGRNGSGSTSGTYSYVDDEGVTHDSYVDDEGVAHSFSGLYNFYNIGASAGKHPVANGLRWASQPAEKGYMLPWTSPYRSVIGGACYIGKYYINAGQDTLYLEKFDVESNYKGLYWHQYMGNIEAAGFEGRRVYKNYKEMNLLGSSFRFKIPVYDNMPETPCPLPTE